MDRPSPIMLPIDYITFQITPLFSGSVDLYLSSV